MTAEWVRGMRSFDLESTTADGSCAVIRVTGEVDVYSAPQLREHVVELVDQGVTRIIADLRNVEFLDSTGLGVLVGSLRRVRAQRGSLALVAASGRIHELFELTGLINAFDLYPSIPAAIAADGHWQAAVRADGGSDADAWCGEHGLL
jgi:anti-sigma B factor antagonist